MFSRDNKAATPEPTQTPMTRLDPAQRSNGNGAPSIIGRDLKIKGDLICNGDIQIDGTIEETQSITVMHRIEGGSSSSTPDQACVQATTASTVPAARSICRTRATFPRTPRLTSR